MLRNLVLTIIREFFLRLAIRILVRVNFKMGNLVFYIWNVTFLGFEKELSKGFFSSVLGMTKTASKGFKSEKKELVKKMPSILPYEIKEIHHNFNRY